MTETIAYDALISVVKACREAGVSELEWNGVKLKFGAEPLVNVPIGTEDLQAEEAGHDQVESRIKEDELARLKLEDPLAYEEYMMSDMEKNSDA